MSGTVDRIELLLPFKAEYVSIARLTVSGIASRMGFDIETIEDMKVALSEVCNKLIQKGSEKVDCYRIIFEMTENGLSMTFFCEDALLGSIFDSKDDELGLSIIDALMDRFVFCKEGGYILTMSKVLEGNISK